MGELRKAQKGSGRKGLKKPRSIFLNRIPKLTIHQLSRRGGVERSFIQQEVYYSLENFIINILHDAMNHTIGEQRNTVTVEDIAYALTLRGHTRNGFST